MIIFNRGRKPVVFLEIDENSMIQVYDFYLSELIELITLFIQVASIK